MPSSLVIRCLSSVVFALATTLATAAAQHAQGLTPEQVRTQGEARCRADSPNTDWIDCACAGQKMADVSVENPGFDWDSLASLTYGKCPSKDRPFLEKKVFAECDGGIKMFRTDHESFCHCVATDFMKSYLAPDLNPAYHQQMMTNAMVKCGPVTDANRVKDMKTPIAAGGAAFEKVRAEKEANCRQNNMVNTWADCACVGRKEAEDAATPGENSPTALEQAAIEACPQTNKKTIADFIFTSCDGYQSSIRTDHERLCRCAGEKVANDFVANPKPGLRYHEQLQRQALEACGIADRSTRIAQ